jgi:hypothetical protein
VSNQGTVIVNVSTPPITSLTPAQVAQLPTSTIAGLTVSQLQSLSLPQIAALTPEQLNAMSIGLVAAFDTSQVKALTSVQLVSMLKSGSVGKFSDTARQQLVNSGIFQEALDLMGQSVITKMAPITAQRPNTDPNKILASLSLERLTEMRPVNSGNFVPVETSLPVLIEGQRTIQLDELK